MPTDGPDHTTRPKGHHSGQGLIAFIMVWDVNPTLASKQVQDTGIPTCLAITNISSQYFHIQINGKGHSNQGQFRQHAKQLRSSLDPVYAIYYS